MPSVLPIHRYVALGDSFTEGVGDPDPSRPNGLRGWADRVAEVLAAQSDDFGYANLAIRGRKLRGIVDEQLQPALELKPDLVTIHAGANDVLRPRVDIDAIAASYDDAIAALRGNGARVLMFTTFDPGSSKIYGAVRGRMALFNEWVREIADRHDAELVDIWRMRHIDAFAVMDSDRMHLNPIGHHTVASAVLDVIGLPHPLGAPAIPSRPELSSRQQMRENAEWTRAHLGPWIHRRLTGRSSGDSITAKRPTLAPIEPAALVG